MTIPNKSNYLRGLRLTQEGRDEFNRELGRTLKFARKVLGITQVEMSQVLGIEQSALSRVESGDQKMCAAQADIAIAVIDDAKLYVAGALNDEESERVERYQRLIYGKKAK